MTPSIDVLVATTDMLSAFVLRVTILLALAWCFEFALRQANPRWRILLWRATLAGVLAIVGLSALAPVITLRVLLSADEEVADRAELRISTTGDGHRVAVSQGSPGVFRAPTQMQPPNNVTPNDAAVSQVPGATPDLSDRLRNDAQGEASAVTAHAMRSSFNWRLWLLSAWLVGAIAALMRFVDGVRRLRRIVAASPPAPAPIGDLVRDLAGVLGVARNIDVRESSAAVAPCTVGIFHPVILFPKEMSCDSNDMVARPALAHEVSHLAGWDPLWNAALGIMAAAWWFHPLSWTIRIVHADACDQRCDAIAAAATTGADAYGRLLARVALAAAQRMPSVALPMARSPQVLRRIALLPTGRGRAKLGFGRALTAGLLLVVAAIVLGTTGIDRRIAEAAPPANDEKRENSPAEAPQSPPVQLSGRITDETGAPVTDAALTLSGSGRTGNQRNYLNAKTDADGRYAFNEVQVEDAYRLQIESKLWVGLTNWRELPQLQLSRTSSVVHDFKLARACLVRLRTVDTDGNAIPNVHIYHKNLAADRIAFNGEASTDRDGWAEVGGLAPAETDYLFGTSSDKFAFGKVRLKLDQPGEVVEETVVLQAGVEVPGIALCSDGLPAEPSLTKRAAP